MTNTEAAAFLPKLELPVHGPGLRVALREGRIHFEGGRFGAHSLDFSCSTPERVLAHWKGYVLSSNGQGVNTIQVGAKVTFDRGTKVPPVGRVLKLYTSRWSLHQKGGISMAIVRFAMVNGRLTTYRLPVAALTPVVEA